MGENRGYEVPLGSLSEAERNHSVLKPYGVFGVIAPFNFRSRSRSGWFARWPPETIVLKPSEQTALCGSLIAEILAGLPEGVASIVHGGAGTGKAIAEGDVDGSRSPARQRSALDCQAMNERPYARPALTGWAARTPRS